MTAHRLTKRLRVALGMLAFLSVYIGVPATFFPRTFYEHFPWGFGSYLVDLGPYSEHLTRDAGALYLGFAFALGCAALRPTPALVRAVSGGYLIATIPHALFHAHHLETSGTVPTIIQAGTLVITAAVCVLALRDASMLGRLDAQAQPSVDRTAPAAPGPGVDRAGRS
jgi:hypothetical protein